MPVRALKHDKWVLDVLFGVVCAFDTNSVRSIAQVAILLHFLQNGAG